MTTYYLAALPSGASGRGAARLPIPSISLESMNGLYSIPLDGSTGWIRMPGATGLEMPPIEVISESQPDVDGATVKEVRVLSRPVFLPIYWNSGSGHLDFLRAKDLLRQVINPKVGAFRIVGRTARTQRELVVNYLGGLEGLDSMEREGLAWGKFGINAVAHQPFARGLKDRSLEFRMAGEMQPFLGPVGGSDAPWPPVFGTASVIGDNMEVYIDSDVPLYPTLEITGPMSSFEGDLSPLVVHPDGTSTVIEDQSWYVNMPLGVPAGQDFRLVTDPTAFSARLNGAFAAGRIDLGSTIRPFHPGLNVLNVTAPGTTDATLVRLSWRELFWSLW